MSATLQKPKPGLAAALLIPFVIWLVASVIAVVFLVMGIQRAEEVADDFARVSDGETSTVELSSSGGYRIWIDESTSGDRFSPSASATITGPDGQDVPTRLYSGSLSYNDLEAVLTFDAPEAGEYQITVTETGFESGTAGTEFAIGKGNPFSEAGTGILLMFLIGSIGFVIALIVLIVMLVKRGRSKRRITQASFPGGYGGGYGSPGGYPPPGQYPPPPGSSW
ncbi:MAG TPA: PPC domain-containing protein [Iamia sp.]|nr:PPC domain-containing protein [Iamia sp.]